MAVNIRTTVEETLWGDGEGKPEAARARAFAHLINGDLVQIRLKMFDGKAWKEVELHKSTKQPLKATLQEMYHSVGHVLDELERRGKGGDNGSPSDTD